VADLTDRERIQSPALIVVGDVVKLHEKLHWFEELKDMPAADHSFPNPFLEALAG
jgi:hypothetical protein